MAQSLVDTIKHTLNIGTSDKKVLLLGAGYVVAPALKILSSSGVAVTVACRTLESAQKIAQGVAGATGISLDVTNSDALNDAVSKVDLAISLIPYTYHVTVLKACIKNKVNLVTTSYISPAMLELEKEVEEAGIIVFNEIGLDPGIDHLWAVKTIDEVHRAGGKIETFLSYCGGLTAPENSDNPLGYRFSWSARGMLLALRNTANFWRDGKMEETLGKDLMNSAVPYETGFPGFAFVAYPNRDSTPYKQRYDIPEAETIIRGTLRYPGFPELFQVLVDMGFFSDAHHDFLADPAVTWADATARVLAAKSAAAADLEAAIASATTFRDDAQKARMLAGLRWIGVFSDRKITPRGTPLDVLCAELERKMQYEPGQRDMIFLQHKFGIVHKDGSRETRAATLCEYGEPIAPGSTSAMARLVGVPCGIASLMVLNGQVEQKGLIAPLQPKLAARLREQLILYGINMTEKTLA